jgi:hypothetical protein
MAALPGSTGAWVVPRSDLAEKFGKTVIWQKFEKAVDIPD